MDRSEDLRAADERRRRADKHHLPLALAAGLVAFLLATAWSQGSEALETSAGRREKLADLVAARQRRTDALERQLNDARRRLEDAAKRSGRGRLLRLLEDVNRLSALGGRTAVSGSGIIVDLADSPLAVRRDPEAADFHIQDVDIQLVVNALWSAGAEALSINRQRIVGTTAIRSAGGAILVNYRVLTSPYTITAIGDAARLERSFSGSKIAKRFRSWVEVYRLGFSVRTSRRLTVPAYAGTVRFRYAGSVEER